MRADRERLSRDVAGDPHHDVDHAVIARSFDVPPQEIVKLNNLVDGGQTLQIGQVLEIPTDMVLVESLPTVPPSSSTEP
jgi:LysM repeat protein